MNLIIRHIIGYILGITVFVFLIPYGLYGLHQIETSFFNIAFINNMIIRIIIFIPIFVVGIFFVIWSNIYLLKIGKGGPANGFGIAISPRTKKLVTTGPYRYSRNPMVFGAFSLYFSISIILNSLVCLVLLIVMLLIASVYLKLSEERRLIKDFGQEYLDYRKNISMIFPMRRTRQNN
jgi:protein-S-isoprenylcysteine O-methyltransferase Ste14